MRHPGDTVPNMFIGSLADMQPRDSIGLRTVYFEQLKEWLSNAEGPNLIEGMEATKPDRLLGMAVSFDPVHYYPPTGSNAVVGMWEVLMLVDSEAAAQVSGVAETVDYFR